VVDTSVSHSLLFNNDNIVMDDWKLNPTPIVKFETPNKRYAYSGMTKYRVDRLITASTVAQ